MSKNSSLTQLSKLCLFCRALQFENLEGLRSMLHRHLISLTHILLADFIAPASPWRSTFEIYQAWSYMVDNVLCSQDLPIQHLFLIWLAMMHPIWLHLLHLHSLKFIAHGGADPVGTFIISPCVIYLLPSFLATFAFPEWVQSRRGITRGMQRICSCRWLSQEKSKINNIERSQIKWCLSSSLCT